MVDSRADISFCSEISYNIKDEKINIIQHGHYPKDVSIYKKQASYYHGVYNYLIADQKIAGSTVFSKTKVLLYYMNIIKDRVKFLEDFFIRLAVLDGKKIVYFPQVAIWYEFGDGGITTSHEKKWKKIYDEDNVEMWNICLEYCKDKSQKIKDWIEYAIRYDRLYQDRDKNAERRWIRVRAYLKNPIWVLWRSQLALHKKVTPKNGNVDFILNCFQL